MTGWDWAGASQALQPAQRLLQEHCPEQSWLLLQVRYHLGATWYHLGEHARLASEMGTWIAEMRERNDALSVALLAGLGHGFARHLMADRPDLAIQELEQALSYLPAAPFSFAHLGGLVGTAFALRYRGGEAAHEYLERAHRDHGRTFILRNRVGRDLYVMLRLKSAITAALASGAGRRALLLEEAAHSTKKLLGSRSPYARGQGELARAQLDALAGRATHALVHARNARSHFDQLRHFDRWGAHYVEALLLGKEAGRAQREAVVAQLQAQGWREPLAALTMIAPCVGSLSEFGASSRASDQGSERTSSRPRASGSP